MDNVHADNVNKRINSERERARLAESAHAYFTKTTEGKSLLKMLAHDSGSKFPAFSGHDNFNSHSAAFRDGMRATFLIIADLINDHEESHERRTGN